MLRGFARTTFGKALFVITMLVVTGHCFSATMSVEALIAFDKSLGISSDSDISYGNMKAAPHERVSIAPDGAISSENGGAVFASDSSHPGRIVIDDGRDQQFAIVTGRYTAHENIRPLKALCSMDGKRNVPCDKMTSNRKGLEAKTLLLGMVIQVMDQAVVHKGRTQPSFDLAVVYF